MGASQLFDAQAVSGRLWAAGGCACKHAHPEASMLLQQQRTLLSQSVDVLGEQRLVARNGWQQRHDSSNVHR